MQASFSWHQDGLECAKNRLFTHGQDFIVKPWQCALRWGVHENSRKPFGDGEKGTRALFSKTLTYSGRVIDGAVLAQIV